MAFHRMNGRINPAIVIIRLLVGWVFLVEGLLKFVMAADLGSGRFASIGIPAPYIMAPFVGVIEIIGGALLIIGMFTRIAALILLINISVAILSTKIPIWLGHGYWRFTLPQLKHYGFLSMLHEARTDISMVLGLLFLLLMGAGKWSVDALRRKPDATTETTKPSVTESQPTKILGL